MILFLMTIHLISAVLICILWQRGTVYVSPAMLVICFLLPIWGPVSVLVAQIHIMGGQKADQEAESSRFGITDEVYRNIRMDKGGVDDVLPIEDVLVSGSPRQRRSLLLSVLHSGPKDFVRPLRIAGVNDDTEVVHYAVTALVEIRSEYTQRISELEKKLTESPGDPELLLDCADLYEEYLNSGLPENSERMELISDCRNKLERFLNVIDWQSRAMGNARPGTYAGQRLAAQKRIAAMCLLQGDVEAAEKYTGMLQQENPFDGDCCMLRIRAKALVRDGSAIARIIREAQERNVYFSPEQRKQLEFWSAVSS